MDPEKKAELLNSQFSTFFTEDDGGLPTIQSNFFSFLPQMRHIEINPTVIKNAIDKIKNSSSKTPDDIPSVFIKNCYTSLLVPLSILFNMILQTGKIPDFWRKALIIPIYKKGVSSDPSNYRPISLTSVLCRIFEQIIRTYLISHIQDNHIISSVQHGFMPLRSTLSQQLILLEELTYNSDNDKNSEMIYLDFSKAFDSVSHKKLIYLLGHLGINEKVLHWITEYLSERTQQTIVDGALSSPCKVKVGYLRARFSALYFFSCI